MPREIPDGFTDDGSDIPSQIQCENCQAIVNIGVEHGESPDEHQCYSNDYDETGGMPAPGF